MPGINVVYECTLAYIPNNKNVTFLMGNRCKMKMMMIAKLLTCRVLFKKYNGPYHLLLTSYIHTFVDVLYKKYLLLHLVLTSSSPVFFSYFSESVRPPKMHLILKIDWQQYIRKDQIMHIGLNLIGSVLTPNYFLGTGIDLSSKYSYL